MLQVKNLEDEIKRATDLTDVIDLTRSKSLSEFKHDFIRERRLFEKLIIHSFDISKIWVTSPTGCFARFTNNGIKIKLK